MRCLLSILAAILFLAICTATAWGQEGILTFSVEPVVLEVSPGGRAVGHLAVENVSPYEADDIELTWAGPAALALEPAPPHVAVLRAFASTSIDFSIVATGTAQLTQTRGEFEVIYSYCIGELCYQVVDPVAVTLRVASGPQTVSATAAQTANATPTAPRSDAWRWLAFAVAALLVIAAVFARRTGKLRTILAASLVAASAAALGLGVSLGQHEQARAVGDVLCTSCVGIETVETRAPRLSPTQAAAVDRLTTPVDLLVFYAPWCRSCPYAEGLVDLVASRNPLVRYRLVNAEVERDLAEQHGITRSGRTVVPAILRVDSGKVLFGAENLGDRLLTLLEGKI